MKEFQSLTKTLVKCCKCEKIMHRNRKATHICNKVNKCQKRSSPLRKIIQFYSNFY